MSRMTSTPCCARPLAEDLDEVGGAVVDGSGAETLARAALAVGACRGKDGRAERPRELNGGRADPARAPVDEHALAFRELAALEEIGPDREERFRNRRGFARSEPVGQRERLRRRRHAVLRVATARHERAHCVPDVPPRDVGTDGRDGAGNLETRDVRCAGRRRILPQPLQDVRTIHTGRLYAHQYVAGSRHGHRAFDQTQDLGPTRCRDFDRSHSGSKAISFQLSAKSLQSSAARLGSECSTLKAEG